MEIVFNDLQTRVICSCLYRDPSFSSVHPVRNFKLSLVCLWLRPKAAPCLRGELFQTLLGHHVTGNRKVDQEGDMSKRDKGAARKFFRKVLKGLRYVPHAIITDKLRS